MARISPLRKMHQQAEASLVFYGAPEADVQVVETFGELELEYAALRKACILIDQPQRAVLEVTGDDRHDFLNRMVTQELKGLASFQVRRSFWLNRKGRIDADLRMIDLSEQRGRLLLDLDTHAAARTVEGLSNFIITEDVRIRDISEEVHRLALHGPTAKALLRQVSQHIAGPSIEDLAPDRACILSIRGHEVIVDRDDSAGEVALELLVPVDGAMAIYQQLVETGQEHNGGGQNGSEPASRFRLRPAGWHAYNIARIEAGRPLYNIDFGPDSLPHESGILRDRVSFTKGCYLGQEIVARMESRGHSKRSLLAVRCEQQMMAADGEGAIPMPRQPVTGSYVWPSTAAEGGAGEADPVGAVTSSTLSPMLSAMPICFAMVKPGFREPGMELLLDADGVRIRGTVQDGLVFWKRS